MAASSDKFELQAALQAAKAEKAREAAALAAARVPGGGAQPMVPTTSNGSGSGYQGAFQTTTPTASDPQRVAVGGTIITPGTPAAPEPTATEELNKLKQNAEKKLSNKEISDEEIYLNNQIIDQINNLKS